MVFNNQNGFFPPSSPIFNQNVIWMWLQAEINNKLYMIISFTAIYFTVSNVFHFILNSINFITCRKKSSNFTFHRYFPHLLLNCHFKLIWMIILFTKIFVFLLITKSRLIWLVTFYYFCVHIGFLIYVGVCVLNIEVIRGLVRGLAIMIVLWFIVENLLGLMVIIKFVLIYIWFR